MQTALSKRRQLPEQVSQLRKTVKKGRDSSPVLVRESAAIDETVGIELSLVEALSVGITAALGQ